MTTATPSRIELLTPLSVAEWLGVTVQQLADWRWRKVGPAYTKIGRMIRYDRSQVEAFIDAGRVETA